MKDDNKKVRGRASRAELKRRKLRDMLWPTLDENHLWLRKKSVGFTTIPRVMSFLGRAMDQASGKGFPLFGTYFSLWCRVYDEAFVEIRSSQEMAYESGFNGTRGEVTWKSRMRRLQDLGFISIKPGLSGDFQYILIYNPILIVRQLYKDGKVDEKTYGFLILRLNEVGADDLEGVM